MVVNFGFSDGDRGEFGVYGGGEGECGVMAEKGIGIGWNDVAFEVGDFAPWDNGGFVVEGHFWREEIRRWGRRRMARFKNSPPRMNTTPQLFLSCQIYTGKIFKKNVKCEKKKKLENKYVVCKPSFTVFISAPITRTLTINKKKKGHDIVTIWTKIF